MPPRPGSSAPARAAVAFAALILAATLAGRSVGGVAIDVPWVPSLGLRLDLALDGLGVLYALLASGIGLAVFIYGTAYLPRHLAHDDRPRTEDRRFWPWMAVFLIAMVGLACARDLVLLFLFFDLTAIASYFLIGFDRQRVEARGAALMAFTVTGISAVLLLLGAVILGGRYGTTSIPDLAGLVSPEPMTTAALVGITIAALAKSAQVPLHFWLPRAMAAPTPVSAYLHSAAMVAAGVLVLGRVHPLLATDPSVLGLLVIVGFGSILVGGILALAHDQLKQVLAHSTISQYGYVVLLYGLAGPAAAGAAAFYVVAHAVAKSALFMTAGAVTEATGKDRLSELGGLGRSMPVLALASGVAAASLAALPLTIGFFKDELFFKAALEAGPAPTVAAVIAAGLTVAYTGRFWGRLFLGRRRHAPSVIPVLLTAPIVALAGVALIGGVVVEPFVDLAAEAAAVTYGAPVTVSAAYHLDARPENLMAVAAWALGGLLLAAGPVRDRVAAAVARAGDAAGPRIWYAFVLSGLHVLSHRLHDAEIRDLRTSLTAVVVPTGIFVGLGFVATESEGLFVAGEVGAENLPIVALLGLVGIAALVAARDRERLRPVMALSVLGFGLAGVYALLGAPDVALVAVVVETVLTLVFVAVYARLPERTIDTESHGRPHHHGRHAAAGVFAGVAAFAAVWAALSRTPMGLGDAAEHVRLTPEAHGSDVVTVILADFRGLDTMVEITVLAVATVGSALLLRRGRLW